MTLVRRATRLALAAALTSGVVVAGRAPAATAKHCSFNTAHSIRQVNTTAKLVSLTFDDGPAKPMTLKVLATLKAKNVKATFFVVGRAVKSRQAIAQQIVAEGHEIANHSYTHALGVPNKIVNEIDPTTQVIQQATGVTPTLFRAPGGCLNKALDDAATARGLTPIQWTQHSGDSSSPRPTKRQVCRNALRGAKPGAIIVFHDNGPMSGRGNHKSTLDALPCIIDGFRAKGFEMVTVTELLSHAGQ